MEKHDIRIWWNIDADASNKINHNTLLELICIKVDLPSQFLLLTSVRNDVGGVGTKDTIAP